MMTVLSMRIYKYYPIDQDTSESLERSSSNEYTVRGHGQHYHYKDGSVKWKDKDPNKC